MSLSKVLSIWVLGLSVSLLLFFGVTFLRGYSSPNQELRLYNMECSDGRTLVKVQTFEPTHKENSLCYYNLVKNLDKVDAQKVCYLNFKPICQFWATEYKISSDQINWLE